MATMSEVCWLLCVRFRTNGMHRAAGTHYMLPTQMHDRTFNKEHLRNNSWHYFLKLLAQSIHTQKLRPQEIPAEEDLSAVPKLGSGKTAILHNALGQPAPVA